MNEQHTEGTAEPPRDTVADKAEDVLGHLTGGNEEHPVEGHADAAQRETPRETRPDRGNGTRDVDTNHETRTHQGNDPPHRTECSDPLTRSRSAGTARQWPTRGRRFSCHALIESHLAPAHVRAIRR
jgi:hypothetical protein